MKAYGVPRIESDELYNVVKASKSKSRKRI